MVAFSLFFILSLVGVIGLQQVSPSSARTAPAGLDNDGVSSSRNNIVSQAPSKGPSNKTPSAATTTTSLYSDPSTNHATATPGPTMSNSRPSPRPVATVDPGSGPFMDSTQPPTKKHTEPPQKNTDRTSDTTPLPTVASLVDDVVGVSTTDDQFQQQQQEGPLKGNEGFLKRLSIALAFLLTVSIVAMVLALGIRYHKIRNRRSLKRSPAANSPLV